MHSVLWSRCALSPEVFCVNYRFAVTRLLNHLPYFWKFRWRYEHGCQMLFTNLTYLAVKMPVGKSIVANRDWLIVTVIKATARKIRSTKVWRPKFWHSQDIIYNFRACARKFSLCLYVSSPRHAFSGNSTQLQWHNSIGYICRRLYRLQLAFSS